MVRLLILFFFFMRFLESLSEILRPLIFIFLSLHFVLLLPAATKFYSSVLSLNPKILKPNPPI